MSVRTDVSGRLNNWVKMLKRYKQRGYIREIEFEQTESVIKEMTELSKLLGSK